MGLIFDKSHIKAHFVSQWMVKYVPAILSYGEKSAKKNVFSVLANMDETSQYT